MQSIASGGGVRSGGEAAPLAPGLDLGDPLTRFRGGHFAGRRLPRGT